MKIIVQQDGKLYNVFDTVEDAAVMTGLSIDEVNELIDSGNESMNDLTFDVGVIGIEYEGWGMTDERDIVI